MALSKRLRFEILRRDNHTCRYCGASAPDAVLTVDHVVPIVLGGSDDPTNLVTACRDCNAGKSSVPADATLVEDVRQDALRWARAMQAALAAREAEVEEASRFRAVFAENWVNVVGGGLTSIPASWADSIDRFRCLGITEAVLVDAIEKADRKRLSYGDTFRYFCGILHRTLDDTREAASARLTADEVDQ